MIIGDQTLLGWAVDIAFVFIMAGMLLAFVRLARGPSLADRVVALDLMTVLSLAFSGLYAIGTESAAFLDVAIALALVAFLATVAFARFVERRSARRSEPEQAMEERT